MLTTHPKPIPVFSEPVYRRYLGMPFVPLQFDCWSLVRQVYADELNIHLPRVTIDAANMRAVVAEFRGQQNIRRGFCEVHQPEHLAVMEYGRVNACHVGLYVETPNGPKILHCDEGSGVVLEWPHRMKLPLLGIYTHA